MKDRKTGFTLAEVLITLGIIGVVAAMTMPTLIQKQQEKVTVNQLKKVYTTLAQTITLAQSDYGSPESWDWGDSANKEDTYQVLKKYFVPYMKVTRLCRKGEGCVPDVMYRRLNGTDHANYKNENPAIILHDGTLIFMWVGVYSDGSVNSSAQVLCYLFVDLNGSHLPNQFGRDTFMFAVTPQGMWPVGLVGEKYGIRDFTNTCRRNIDSYLNGIGCTAWIIYNENMDYLHCDDLSWEGKNKCK